MIAAHRPSPLRRCPGGPRSGGEQKRPAFPQRSRRRRAGGPGGCRSTPLRRPPSHCRCTHASSESLPQLLNADAAAVALKPLLQRVAEVSRLRRAAVVVGCLVFPARLLEHGFRCSVLNSGTEISGPDGTYRSAATADRHDSRRAKAAAPARPPVRNLHRPPLSGRGHQ